MLSAVSLIRCDTDDYIFFIQERQVEILHTRVGTQMTDNRSSSSSRLNIHVSIDSMNKSRCELHTDVFFANRFLKITRYRINTNVFNALHSSSDWYFIQHLTS